MKAYSISSPEQLRTAADMAKWQNDMRRMRDVATVWSSAIRQNPDARIPFKITLELGRSAIVFKENGREKTLLAICMLRVPANLQRSFQKYENHTPILFH